MAEWKGEEVSREGKGRPRLCSASLGPKKFGFTE